MNKKEGVIQLDTHNPEQVARLLLGLGYEREQVAQTLVSRCDVTMPDALVFVERAIKEINQGGPDA